MFLRQTRHPAKQPRLPPVPVLSEGLLCDELAYVRMVLVHVKLDRDEPQQERDGLRRERDAWRTVTEKLNDCVLRAADEQRLASLQRSLWRRLTS
jgi:hypothetical protein